MIFFSTSRTQSLTKLVAKNLKICPFKMPYFLNLKGYEMHVFGLARLKLVANRYFSPAPTLQCWGSIGDEEHNFMFQHCHGGAGDDFTVRCKFFCNNFVQDCITARKAADISNGFWCVISKRVNQFS